MQNLIWQDYYGKQNISPVKQDVTNIAQHYSRREKLYRQLGIPRLLFAGKSVLEVGPGGGYNTLAFLQWGAKVTMVEPNAKGREDIRNLFEQKKVEQKSYSLKADHIEDFISTEKYAVIIAEGFIPWCVNKKEIIDKMIDLVAEDGIIVITCMDDYGMFVEQLKRLAGHILVQDITDFDEKVVTLLKVFAPQLKNLPQMSRSPEDWVIDQFLNPLGTIKQMLSLSEALDFFPAEFDVLGTSQQVFTDYSWYKDTEFDYKEDYRRQFVLKNHNFLFAYAPESSLSFDDSVFLQSKIKEIRQIMIGCELNYQQVTINKLVQMLEDILPIMSKISHQAESFTKETINIFKNLNREINFSEYPTFFSSFGRSQQYISFVKKGKYNNE